MTKPFRVILVLICCLLVGCSVHPIPQGPRKYRWVSAGENVVLEECVQAARNSCEIKSKKISMITFQEELFQAFRIPGGAPPAHRVPGQKVPAQSVDQRITELAPSFLRLQSFQADIAEELKLLPSLGQTSYGPLDHACFENNELWRRSILKLVQKYSSQWWEFPHRLSRLLAGHFVEKPVFPGGVSLVTHMDWVTIMGDSPYSSSQSTVLVEGVSPQQAEVFLNKMALGLRLPNSIDWHQALQKNPKICNERVWIKNGQVYFISPKCYENKLRDRAPWVSIKVMKLAVMKDE